ncbi:hypothetical protein FACS1894202_11470 [Clostridia bacterium]|nr:hypothetical protein FACS1894202_11470 [Clostridia bacterium]
MSTLNELIAVLMNVIRISAAGSIVFAFIRIMATEDEQGKYKKRIRNTLVFYIITECVFQIKDLAIFYFGG